MPASDFSKIRIGLKCVLGGVLAYVAATIISMVFGGHTTITAIVRVLVIIALLLTVFGETLCLTVPAAMPGRGFVFAAVGCSVIALFFVGSLFFWDPVATLDHVKAMWGATLVAAALFTVGDILFNFFLKFLARYVRDKANARRAGALIMLKFVTLALVLIAFLLVFTLVGMALSVIILFMTAIIWAIIVFQYMGLLSGLSYSLLAADRRSSVPTGEEDEDEEDEEGENDAADESDNPFESFK